MKEFWLCFVPLFVAVDALGVLPMFIGLTESMERPMIRSIIYQSVFCDFHKRFNHHRKDPETGGPRKCGSRAYRCAFDYRACVLTTSILLLNEHSFLITAIAILVNILIAGIVFFFSQYIIGFLGKAGAKTVSKIASLLLAAISVMIIRKGIEYFISSWI